MAAPLRIAARPASGDGADGESGLPQNESAMDTPQAALQKALDAPKARALVLQLEQELERFLVSREERLVYVFPSGFQRMLVHRCAECYHLDHFAESLRGRRQVVLTRTAATAAPSTSLSELVRLQESSSHAAVTEVKILARKPRKETRERDTGADDSPVAASPHSPTTEAAQPPPFWAGDDEAVAAQAEAEARALEEREAEYARARARIFEDSADEPQQGGRDGRVANVYAGAEAAYGGWQAPGGPQSHAAALQMHARQQHLAFAAGGGVAEGYGHWGAPAAGQSMAGYWMPALPPSYLPAGAFARPLPQGLPLHGQGLGQPPHAYPSAATAPYAGQSGHTGVPWGVGEAESDSRQQWPSLAEAAHPQVQAAGENGEHGAREEAGARARPYVAPYDFFQGSGQPFAGYGQGGLQGGYKAAAEEYGRPQPRRKHLYDPRAAVPTAGQPPPAHEYDVAVVPVSPASQAIPAAAMWSKGKAATLVRVRTPPPPQSSAEASPTP